MKKYKLSKIYDADTFCSKIETYKYTLYLLEDENGFSLKELSESHYNVLKALMDYQVLVDLNNGIYKK